MRKKAELGRWSHILKTLNVMLSDLNSILCSNDLQNGVFSKQEGVQDGVPEVNIRISINK